MFKRAYSITIYVLEQILGVIIAALALIVIAAVFFRYVLSNSLSWTDEAAGFLLVWVTFLGAITALERGKHINFDSVVLAFPRPVSQGSDHHPGAVPVRLPAASSSGSAFN